MVNKTTVSALVELTYHLCVCGGAGSVWQIEAPTERYSQRINGKVNFIQRTSVSSFAKSENKG